VCELVEKMGGTIAGISFLIELAFLKGIEKIAKHNVTSFLKYE